MPRRNSHSDNWEFGGARPREERVTPEPKPRLRRAATTVAFTALFFSGAALTAVAGDKFSHVSSDDPAAAETTPAAPPPGRRGDAARAPPPGRGASPVRGSRSGACSRAGARTRTGARRRPGA